MFRNNITLVLGNGFDLDLGLKTLYSDFVNNYWKPNAESLNSALCRYIIDDSKFETWGGLEVSLEKYAELPESYHTFEEDESCFRLIVFCLRLFLHRALFGAPMNFDVTGKSGPIFRDRVIFNEDSCAAYICDSLVRGNNIKNIVTFNYTDILQYTDQVLKGLIVSGDLDVDKNYRRRYKRTFVHRIDEDSKMILGISADAQISDKRYVFLKKYRQGYIPPIQNTLLESDTIIFYGLSFSKPDFGYFKEFFQSISGSKFKQRTIYLVGKDDIGYEDSLSQIEIMLDGDLSGLINHNNIIQVNTEHGISSKGFRRMFVEVTD